MIQFGLTVDTVVFSWTGALVTFASVSANSSILAWFVRTFLGLHFTMLASETQRTDTHVIIFLISLTCTSIDTRLVRTFIADPGLTVGASVSRRATASVGSLSSVPASGSIETRLVIGAVVEILIAEQSTPTIIASALEGLFTRAVDAAWVANAQVTELASPTGFTSEKMKGKKLKYCPFFKIYHLF